MKQGYFITFEGPDGSGKTTVSTAVSKRLNQEGYQVVYTREPGGNMIAEKIRQIILDPENTTMDPRTEALLYAASRRQHLVEKVLPLLRQGISVISDRFVDSSLAYQGYARGIGIEEIYQINEFAIEGHMPDCTIYLDIDVATGLSRIYQNRTFLDRLEMEDTSFHQRVFTGYQKVVERYRPRMNMIDANQPLDQVIEDAYHIVKGLLDER